MCNLGLLCGTLLWVILMVKGAGELRGASGTQEYIVQCGPFVLTHISKHAVAGGFTAGFSLESGLVWYILSWIAAGILLGGIVLYAGGRGSKISDN